MDVAGLSHSRLFYITDTISNYHFLIDTSMEVSVLPATSAEHWEQQADFNLVTVNGASIPTFGKRSLTLNLGLRRTFRWVFVIANVLIPIIGADLIPSLLQPIGGYDCQFNYRTESSRNTFSSRISETIFPSQNTTFTPLLPNIQPFSNHTSAAILVNIILCTTLIQMVLLSMHDHEDWLQWKAARQEF